MGNTISHGMAGPEHGGVTERALQVALQIYVPPPAGNFRFLGGYHTINTEMAR